MTPDRRYEFRVLRNGCQHSRRPQRALASFAPEMVEIRQRHAVSTLRTSAFAFLQRVLRARNMRFNQSLEELRLCREVVEKPTLRHPGPGRHCVERKVCRADLARKGVGGLEQSLPRTRFRVGHEIPRRVRKQI